MTHDPPSHAKSIEDMTPSLVARLRAGDSEAGVLLERYYRDPLRRFCWGYLGQIEEAEDAVQDVCCKVLGAGDIPERFRPWIYKIARNHCLNLLRGRASRKDGRSLPAESRIHEEVTGHLTRLVRDEQRVYLAKLFSRLPDDQREVLRLRYVEELSRAEIAEVLDIPPSVAKSRLYEGLKRLRDDAANIQ